MIVAGWKVIVARLSSYEAKHVWLMRNCGTIYTLRATIGALQNGLYKSQTLFMCKGLIFGSLKGILYS